MFPFPVLPPIPGPIKDGLKNLGDFVNPFEWFSKALQAVYHLLTWYFEFIIAHPPRFKATGVADYVYGNAIGLAGFMIFVITVALMCISVFRVQRAVSVAEAIVIAAFIAVGGPLFFGFIDALIQLGDTLCKSVMFYHPKSHHGLLQFSFDASVGPLLGIGAFGFTTLLGAANVFVVFIYEALNTFLKIIMLPALALRPLGRKTKNFSDWTFSAALVSMVVGRPVMILSIEIGQWAGDNILGGSTAGTVFFLCAGLALSLWLQVKLYQQAQKIVAQVSGNTISRVFGKVETTQKNTSNVNLASVNAKHANTMQPVQSVVQKQLTVRERASRYVNHETKRALAARVAVVAASVGAGTASGGTSKVAGAVTTAAKSAAKRAELRRDRS